MGLGFTVLLIIVLGLVTFIFIVKALTTEPPKVEKKIVIENEDFVVGFGVDGINRNGCTLKHVGAFLGTLVAEPDNEFDVNAIMVIHEDGTHIGYIKARETAYVRYYLGNDFKKFPCIGQIKYVEEKEDYEMNGEKSEDENEETQSFFVGRIYVDSRHL